MDRIEYALQVLLTKSVKGKLKKAWDDFEIHTEKKEAIKRWELCLKNFPGMRLVERIIHEIQIR